MLSFHVFDLSWTYLSFVGSAVIYSNNFDSTSFKIFLYWDVHSFFLRNVEWHCIGKIFIVSWHTMAKEIFRCFDKQWYLCLINLIVYNIAIVFSIIAWYFMRDHQLFYIDHKYIIYLSLSIIFFGYNLYLTKFQHVLFINIFLISAYQLVKKTFSRLLP